jgi:hypothetical protein
MSEGGDSLKKLRLGFFSLEFAFLDSPGSFTYSHLNSVCLCCKPRFDNSALLRPISRQLESNDFPTVRESAREDNSVLLRY